MSTLVTRRREREQRERIHILYGRNSSVWLVLLGGCVSTAGTVYCLMCMVYQPVLTDNIKSSWEFETLGSNQY